MLLVQTFERKHSPDPCWLIKLLEPKIARTSDGAELQGSDHTLEQAVRDSSPQGKSTPMYGTSVTITEPCPSNEALTIHSALWLTLPSIFDATRVRDARPLRNNYCAS